MNSLLNGASAPKSQASRQANGVKPAAATQKTGAALDSLGRTLRAHELMVAARHERISIAAYLLAEARGFEPGHEAEDWLRAQLEIDAEDARIALI